MRRILVPLVLMLVAASIGAAVAADPVKKGNAAQPAVITDDVAQKYDEMEKARALAPCPMDM